MVLINRCSIHGMRVNRAMQHFCGLLINHIWEETVYHLANVKALYKFTCFCVAIMILDRNMQWSHPFSIYSTICTQAGAWSMRVFKSFYLIWIHSDTFSMGAGPSLIDLLTPLQRWVWLKVPGTIDFDCILMFKQLSSTQHFSARGGGKSIPCALNYHVHLTAL